MPSQEDIAQLQEQLQAHRQTLSHYLVQQAKLGSAYTPPGTAYGIRETRNKIQHIKQVLAARGVQIESHPDDEEPQDSQAEHSQVSPSVHGSAPPVPQLFIGREDDLRKLKEHLGLFPGEGAQAPITVLTAIRGWPGVGKTTLAAALAHDPDIKQAFRDGVLWASLGQEPNLFGELTTWGRALGISNLAAHTIEEATARLTALLRNQRRLLIVDDVWEAAHAVPFMVGGRECVLLMTTRVTSVAQAVAPTPEHIYVLGVLTEEKALELLRKLAPKVVVENPEASHELVKALEGLPLAIQVAGRLLNVEASYGFGLADLLTEIREGARLLAAQAPADRAEVSKDTIPTVAALLQRSTKYLDEQTLDRFAFLGAFAPNPDTFDLEAMRRVWQVDDPKLRGCITIR